MGVKHKKTLKQKIIADYRHQVYSLENKSSTFFSRSIDSREKNNDINLPSQARGFEKVLDKNISSLININSTKIIRNDEYSYSYVLHDISKTLIITLTLIGLQIILFFLLKNHVLTLPIVRY